jgi:hypothetical protein
MNKDTRIARLLEQFSAENGLNYITGSRLTMKPLAGPLPNAAKPSAPPRGAKNAARRAIKA